MQKCERLTVHFKKEKKKRRNGRFQHNTLLNIVNIIIMKKETKKNMKENQSHFFFFKFSPSAVFYSSYERFTDWRRLAASSCQPLMSAADEHQEGFSFQRVRHELKRTASKATIVEQAETDAACTMATFVSLTAATIKNNY